MDFYDYYSKSEFESFKDNRNFKKKSKKRKKFLKKTKKFFKKLRDKVIDMVLSTASHIALRFFDRKLEKAFA